MKLTSIYLPLLVLIPSFILAMELTQKGANIAEQQLIHAEKLALKYVRKLKSSKLKNVLKEHPHLQAEILLLATKRVDLEPFYNKYHHDRSMHNWRRLFFGSFFGTYCLMHGGYDLNTLLGALVIVYALYSTFPSQEVYNEQWYDRKKAIRQMLTLYQLQSQGNIV